MTYHDDIMREYYDLMYITGTKPKTLTLSQEVYNDITKNIEMFNMTVDKETPPTYYGMSLSVIDGQGVFLWKLE